jgi:MoxR-like ATPase
MATVHRSVRSVVLVESAMMQEDGDAIRRLRDRLRGAVRGRDDVIDLVLIALLADGHVLLEDYPGSGKTTLAKALGDALVDDREEAGVIESFRRIQFTPDLLPSDVTGTSIFDRGTGTFSFRPGPLFAHVLLADEINRTSPKVQAALLEAMAEKQVTVDNQTHGLDEVFFVIATQNPLDVAGTFPLPVAQLDRFLFKIRMTYLEREDELDVLRSIAVRRQASTIEPVRRSELLRARARASEVFVHDAIHEALVDTARAIRADERVMQGVSTRSLVLCIPSLRARAMLQGRDYVRAEDLEALLPPVFGHRVEVGGGIKLQSVLTDAIGPVMERLARRTLQEAS